MTDNYERVVKLVDERMLWAIKQIEKTLDEGDRAAEKLANENSENQVMLQTFFTLYKAFKDQGLRVELTDNDKKAVLKLRKSTFAEKSGKIMERRKERLDKVKEWVVTHNAVPPSSSRHDLYELLKKEAE
jgi:hypothetical protein